MIPTQSVIGPYTLLQRLGTCGVAESFLARTASGDRPEVILRRLLPFVSGDPTRLRQTEERVRDLINIQHPFLVPVLDWFEHDNEHYVVEESVGCHSLSALMAAQRSGASPVPPHVFLNLATQICNGLEALHGRPGKGTGASHVLHLGLAPDSVYVSEEGKVVLGGFALVRSPTVLPRGGVTAAHSGRLRFLAPEQTLSDAELSPATDIFSLGSLLFELATGTALFDADSNLRTIHAVRRAEVEGPVSTVRQHIPGLDRVLHRALAQNPRYRYHRAFVLREDLRALMASYSFSTVTEDTRALLNRIVASVPEPAASTSVRALSTAPMPLMTGGQQETLHSADALDAGLFEDTHQSSGPPPLVTDEQALHAPPEVPAPPPASAPLPADLPEPPASLFDRDATAPEAVSIPAAGSASVPDHAPSAAPVDDDPSFGPDPESEFAGVEMAWDQLIQSSDGAPEDLPSPNPINSTQATWAMEPPPSADGTAPFRGVGPSAELGPPPPLPPVDLRGEPVQPNETAFIPRAAGTPPPPLTAAPPPEALPVLHSPLPPAPAAPANPNDTAILAAPLPPAPPPAAAPPSSADLPPPPRAVLPAAPPAPSEPPVPAAEELLTTPAAPVLAAPVVEEPTRVSGLAEAPAEEHPSGAGLLKLGIAMAAAAVLLSIGVGIWLSRDGAEPSSPAAMVAAAPSPPPAAAAPDEEADEEADEEPDEDAAADAAAAFDLAAEDTGQSAKPTPRPEPEGQAAPPPPDARASSARRSRPRARSVPRVPAPSIPRPTLPTRGDAPEAAPPPSTADAEAPDNAARAPVDMDRAARAAARGGLDDATRRELEAVPIDDTRYTDSRWVLAMNAAQRGDTSAAERFLEQTMALPENRYNPVLLSELAMHQTNRARYATALDNANRAEQHWARIPSTEMFERKATIYEVQAAATQGLLYQAEDDRQQITLVDDALRRWTRFREHASSGSSSERIARADTQIEKLRTIRARLE